MKTLLTLAIALLSMATLAQSDTLSVILPYGSPYRGLDGGDGLVFTVGDVYKYMVDGENPWGDPVYNYIKIVDIEDGWVKYTRSETIDRLDNNPTRVNKLRDFYKLYLKRNEWERLQSEKA